MAARRSGLTALAAALRMVEPDSTNLGELVASNADELGPALGVSVESLRAARGLPDERIAPELATLLERRGEAAGERRQACSEQRALAAASRLARTAIWQGDSLVIDPGLLLGDVLADGSKDLIAFEGELEVAAHRTKLVEIARVLPRLFSDLGASVDTKGLRFSWREGRGGLSLRSQQVRPHERFATLFIVVPERARERVLALPPRNRPGAWIGDVLADLGFGP